jgi:short-subunit dehydrogenase
VRAGRSRPVQPALFAEYARNLALYPELQEGSAYGIVADLADRMQVDGVRRQLADEHADATLLVNAAGLFLPKPFLEYDGASYDSYFELDRAIFFLIQTAVRGMVEAGRGGSIVNIGSM